jgi:hypothetical protein
MLAGLLICLRSNSAFAGAPQPLETEFLDYLLTCESKDDNWTVVADDKLRKKARKEAPKEKSPPADEDKQQEAKP